MCGNDWVREMKLALGTAQFGLPYGVANQSGQVSRGAAASMLELARARGIDTLDTAIAYGDSEACLGEIGVRQFRLITKLPAVPAGTADVKSWVCRQLEGSLERLGVDSLYGLLLHRPAQLLEPGGNLLFDALRDLQESGRVQKIGVSIYAPNELDALLPNYRLDLVQAPFNLVDRRLASSGWLFRLKREGIEVHARSAFLQGLLLMPPGGIPQKFSQWSGIWTRWCNWLEQHPVPALRACLAYPLQFPEIDRIVVGADSREHLSQIIEAYMAGPVDRLPDLTCNDEDLINPAHWPQL